MRSSHGFNRFPLLFKSHLFASLRRAQSRLPFLNHKDSGLESLWFEQYQHSHPLGDERGSCGFTIGGALGVGLPMTLVVIWLCS
jgi:hypothetical protein